MIRRIFQALLEARRQSAKRQVQAAAAKLNDERRAQLLEEVERRIRFGMSVVDAFAQTISAVADSQGRKGTPEALDVAKAEISFLGLQIAARCGRERHAQQ